MLRADSLSRHRRRSGVIAVTLAKHLDEVEVTADAESAWIERLEAEIVRDNALAISGLLKPENGFIKDGYVKFDGHDITNVLGTHVVKLGAVMVPEGRRVFKHLTVDENIRVGSITRKDGSQSIRKDHALMYDHFPRLARVTNRLAGYCSGGEQQMIAIARALMSSLV